MANFMGAVHTLNVTSTAGVSVTTPSEGSFAYDHGQVVTLEGTPDAGYCFVEWSGSIASSDNPASINMDADHDVMAHFAPAPPTLTIRAGEGGRFSWGVAT